MVDGVDKTLIFPSRDEWKAVFPQFFEAVLFESYPLIGGISLWNMLYFEGKART
jgi:hypothetical protein